MKKERRKKFKLANNKGSTAIIVAMCLPMIVFILGFVVEMGILMYSKERLAAATKFTALSATAMYDVKDEKVDLIKNRSAINEVLHENYQEAELRSDGYSISKKNNKIICTIKTNVVIPAFFTKVLGKDSKIISSSYTVTRKIKVLDKEEDGDEKKD